MQNANNWIVKKLSEVATVTMGQSPPSSSYNSLGAGIPFLQGTPPVVDSMGAAVPNQWTTEPTRVVEAGTVLMTVRAPVGELFTTNNSVCLGRGLAGIKANNGVSQAYLNYYLQFSKNQLDTLSQGSTFTAINSGDLKGIQVILPPHQKQEYIGNVLNFIDQNIAKTDQIIQKTEILKQGLMQELLTKGIGHKKFKKTKIGEIPEGWEVVRLSEIIDIKNGYAYKGENFRDYETEKILLTPGNVLIGGGFNFGKLKYYEGEIVRDFVLKAGDIFVALTDLTPQANFLGFPAKVPENLNKIYLHNQRLGLVQTISRKIDLDFLYFILLSDNYRKHIVSGATCTTVRHTSAKKVLDYQFQLPSISEQKVIALYLDSIIYQIEVHKK